VALARLPGMTVRLGGLVSSGCAAPQYGQ